MKVVQIEFSDVEIETIQQMLAEYGDMVYQAKEDLDEDDPFLLDKQDQLSLIDHINKVIEYESIDIQKD